MKTIDLHVHSCISDGSDTPEELVKIALETGLSAFALTDHDSTDGIDRAVKAARGTGLEIIPGIEFSTTWQKHDIHILGYFIDYHAKGFQEWLQNTIDARSRRNEIMCERIYEYANIPIHLSILKAYFPNAVITRAHMATWLFENGYVENRNAAFANYLGDDAPCYVPKKQVEPEEVIHLILQYQGIPVLAHPLLYSLSESQLHLLLNTLKESGLWGIEAIYSSNQDLDESYVRTLAQTYGLSITGGSDYHGSNKPNICLGTGRNQNLTIPYAILENLQNAQKNQAKH